MGTAGNAKIQYESAQSLVEYVAMTDSGDHIVFTSAANVWSDRVGYAPSIRPDGIITGIDILSAGTAADTIDNIAFTAWLAGVLKEVTATTITITRASSLTHIINSIILTGTTLSVIQGTEGSAFSASRAAAGGPAYIPVGSVEIGQVKTTVQASAVITSAEIFQTPGTHQERADHPLYRRPDNTGRGVIASSTSRKYAHIEFYNALSLCHTAGVAKAVYIQYYTPTFTTLESDGFSPADKTSSQASAQRYDKILGYKTDDLKSTSFKAELSDGITDDLCALDGETLLFKFFPDQDAAPFMLTLGVLRFAAAFPQVGPISTSCAVVAKLPTARFTGV